MTAWTVTSEKRHLHRILNRLGFPDNPFQVVIDDFEFDVGDRFTYEYNFFEHWIHDIRVEAIYENAVLYKGFEGQWNENVR
ncbi:plasmid pRiA4b ORF-3 family protein [Escherichia coli]|uniref:plasmid pRiA4b ORF-3 family protein n=1 Tax=Escherichia coli TaxID=562 RepID=UPI001F369827|nr:plasmid pRiA4b ORF-3 family protein [Escherichia coli]MCF7423557.1 plasmid pRiA4b ORF-3 family protein [Escherichia coli]